MTDREIWESMTDQQRRKLLDGYIMTSDIPSNISWEHLDYGTKSAIVFTGDLYKVVLDK
jgi:hypothetical protein